MVSWLSDDVPSLSGGQRDGRCQALLQAIVDRAPIGIVILGPDALFIHVNPAFERMLGYDTAELLRLGVAGITHPDDFLKDLNLYTWLCRGTGSWARSEADRQGERAGAKTIRSRCYTSGSGPESRRRGPWTPTIPSLNRCWR